MYRIVRQFSKSARFLENARKPESVSSNLNVPADATVFSLIQPTGKIHLGNYLGALSNWRKLANNAPGSSKLIFGVADCHALTVQQVPQELKYRRYEAVASMVASGLDPGRCIIYHQSSVPEHTELNWYLTCVTGMGQLNRMTQWKLKAQQSNASSIFLEDVMARTKAGLLCYPILQAADILIYHSTHVPVGDDQSQHLELCRSIASTFNNTFGNIFPIPITLVTPTKKILALKNTSKKMSKSDVDQNSSIYLTEEPEDIARKIRKATTDSIQGPIYYDEVARPGVSNLINIVSGLTEKTVDETVELLNWVQNHKQLKDYVTEVIVEEFADKRKVFNELVGDQAYLESICRDGTARAREIALANIKQVRSVMGMD